MRGCTQCGECLNVCPVFRRHRREEFSPKGKRLLLEPVRSGETDEGYGWDEVFALVRLCAGCGRCQRVCARKLSTADLLAEVRAAHPHWSQHLWELWIKHTGPLWPAIGFLATLAPQSLTPKALETSLAAAKALAGKTPFRPWTRLVRGEGAAPGGPVMLFSGCTARNVRPQWTKTAESLLRVRGYEVLDSTAFACCGATLRHAGRFGAMEAFRQTNAEVWRSMGKPRIATLCASCHHGLAGYAEGFLEGNEGEAWRKSLTPLSALLDGMRAEPLAGKPERYGYHQPCHWDDDPDLPFLAGILPGLAKGAGICCGMGGILKLTDPDLSAAMGAACLADMPSGAAHILTGCSGCAMQLAAFAPEGTAVSHWLDVVIAG